MFFRPLEELESDDDEEETTAETTTAIPSIVEPVEPGWFLFNQAMIGNIIELFKNQNVIQMQTRR